MKMGFLSGEHVNFFNDENNKKSKKKLNSDPQHLTILLNVRSKNVPP